MQATTGTPLSVDAPAAVGRGRRLALLGVVAIVIYALDQTTKWWAQHHLVVGEPRDLVGGWLRLNLTHNAGAAFSLATGYTVILTVVAVVVVVVCLRTARRLQSTGWAIAFGLLLGGALGNLTDRMVRAPGPFRGHVVDFLELPHWPIFNLADASIVAAAALFVLLTLFGVRMEGAATAARIVEDDGSGPAGDARSEAS